MRLRPAEMFSSWPLAYQLTSIVLATALPLILSSLLMYGSLVENERANLRQSLLVSSKTLAQLVDNEIDTFVAIGNTLGLSDSLQKTDLARFHHEANKALELIPGAWLTLNSPDGQILLSTLTPLNSNLPKHIAPEIIFRAFQEKQIQVSDMVFGPVSQRWISFIEVPIFREGAPLYSMSIAMPSERFLGLLKRFEHGEVVAIIDRNRKFVARSHDLEARIGTLASAGWRAAILNAPQGWVDTQNLDGNMSTTGYAQTLRGWTTGIGILTSQIDAPLKRILWLALAISGTLTAIGLLLATLIARRTALGIKLIADRANALSTQHIFNSPPAPFLEAAIITNTLSLVAEKLRAHDAQQLIHRQQIELVSREVNHRSKNLLSVLSSMARFISRNASSVEDFTAKLDDRIYALARCQDLLIKNDWQNADLEELISSQVLPIIGLQLRLNGPKCAVDPENIQALSMIFHELATNAAKYGAASKDVIRGIVTVGWSEASDGKVRIVWSESGFKPINSVKRSGFGSIVIKESSNALNGRSEMFYEENGIRVELELRLSQTV